MARTEWTGGGLTRRAFLRLAAGAGCAGAAGCAGVPFFGSLRKDETLTVFLSDCHVGNWRSTPYQGEKFAACLARVLRLDPLPARMFITGDLAYLWGRAEDYELSRRLLQPVLDAGIELTIGMGNHDRRTNFLERWPEYASRTEVPGRLVTVTRGVHFDFVMLDTLDEPDDPGKWITPGTLDAAQRDWLRAWVRKATRPFLVMGHHPARELVRATPTANPSARAFGDLIMGPTDDPTPCAGYVHGHDHAWYVTRGLRHWSVATGAVGHTASLPSTGHWGDIGYALLREWPDRAELALTQWDFFTPKPAAPDAPPRADWQAIVRDHAGARCSFVPGKGAIR